MCYGIHTNIVTIPSLTSGLFHFCGRKLLLFCCEELIKRNGKKIYVLAFRASLFDDSVMRSIGRQVFTILAIGLGKERSDKAYPRVVQAQSQVFEGTAFEYHKGLYYACPSPVYLARARLVSVS